MKKLQECSPLGWLLRYMSTLIARDWTDGLDIISAADDDVVGQPELVADPSTSALSPVKWLPTVRWLSVFMWACLSRDRFESNCNTKVNVKYSRADVTEKVQQINGTLGLDRYRYRPILASISGDQYRRILIWVSAPIPVALSFVYLSQQSTLLQRTPIVSSLYNIFVDKPRIHI